MTEKKIPECFFRQICSNPIFLSTDWSKVDAHMAKVNSALEAKTRVNLDPEALRWSPMVSVPGSIFGSPFKKANLNPNEVTEQQSSPEKSNKKKRKKKKQNNSQNDDDQAKTAHSTTTSDSDNDSDSNTKKLGANR